MTGVIVVGIVMLWFVVLLVLAWRGLDIDNKMHTRFIIGVITFIWVVVPLGLLLESAASAEQKPCAQYETRMMYNAATKTMMPAQFCVMQGEWVK